jgi:sec-independent protein translocase protein TatB
MFDLTSSKLLILGIVALIVVGPKDLPILLRTLGKYMGMIKRQAAEFRAQFDEAMREAELQQLKQDVETLGHETQKAVREGEQAFEAEMASARRDVDQVMDSSVPVPVLTNGAGAPETASTPVLPPASPASPVEAAAAAAAAAEKSGA